MTGLALLLAAGLCVVLVAPVRISVDWHGWPESPQPHICVRVRWLAVTWRSGATRRVERTRKKRRRSRPDDVGPSGRRWRRMATVPGLLPRVGRLVSDLVRVLAPRSADVRLRVGLDDPVSTGMWWGAAHAIVGGAQLGKWRLRLEPDFTGPVLAGEAHLEWSLRPGRVLWPVVTFMCAPVTWRAGLAVWRGRAHAARAAGVRVSGGWLPHRAARRFAERR